MEDRQSINIAYLKTFQSYKTWQGTFSPIVQGNNEPAVAIEDKIPEEVIGNAIKSLKEKLGFDLLELLKNKPPEYFEKFVLMLLTKMGYGGAEFENFEVVGKSGDNGIDGIIYQDQFGIERIYVQAKRWRDNKVQSKDIRDFIGALSLKGTNKGIFITTSGFTEDAFKTAQINPHNRIVLINGAQLAEYAIKFNVGVQLRMVHEIKDLDNDFFEES